MAGPQDLPPWMNTPGAGSPPPVPPTPPPMPPQQPAWASPPPSPQPVYLPQPSTGLLTFFGVMNLLFALTCGCSNMFFASAWTGFREAASPDQIQETRDRWPDIVDRMRSQLRSQAHGDRDRENAEQIAAFMTDQREPILAAVQEIGTRPTSRRAQGASVGAAVSQLVLLIGSVVLLLRKNAGRWISVLAMLGLVVSTVIAVGAFNDTMATVKQTVMEEVHRNQDSQRPSTLDAKQVDQLFDTVIMGMSGVSWAFAAASCLWPLISGLVLLVSASIRNACRPPMAPGASEVFR